MIFPLRTLVLESPDDHRALEALWALYVSGGLSDELAEKLLSHRNPDVRWWTVRLAGDENRVAPAMAECLAQLARDDSSVAVRSQLASTAKRLPAADAVAIIAALVTHDEDQADPFLPLLIWWAVEQHALADRDDVVSLFTRPEIWHRPLVHDTILERLVRRYAAEASPPGYQACLRLLKAAEANGGAADRTLLLAALDRGLAERSAQRGGSAGSLYAAQAGVQAASPSAAQSAAKCAELPAELTSEVDRAWRENPGEPALVRLATRLGRPGAEARAIAWAGDPRAAMARRLDAIHILGEVGSRSAIEPLVKFLAARESPAVAAAALEALMRFDDERIAAALLAAYPALDAPLRRKRPTCC